MKKLLKAIVWIFTAMVVILVGGGYLLPNEVIVQRQAVIDASPEKVFALAAMEWSFAFAGGFPKETQGLREGTCRPLV